MLMKNVIILIFLMIYPLKSNLKAIVDVDDYEFIGYAICGNFWKSPCIGTLINNKYLLVSGQCLRRGVCGVAGLRAHDMNKAIQVRVVKQLVSKPKYIGKTRFLTSNVGLLELLPPKFLDGTIPTVSIATKNIPKLLQDPRKCETVKWNKYSGMLEYINIMDSSDKDGHFMTCEELIEELSIESVENCKKIAIFKQFSDQESHLEICHSNIGLPLFCKGYQVGILVDCQSNLSKYYENIKINYIEFSLIQDQLSWIEEIVNNESLDSFLEYPERSKKYIKNPDSLSSNRFSKNILEEYNFKFTESTPTSKIDNFVKLKDLGRTDNTFDKSGKTASRITAEHTTFANYINDCNPSKSKPQENNITFEKNNSSFSSLEQNSSEQIPLELTTIQDKNESLDRGQEESFEKNNLIRHNKDTIDDEIFSDNVKKKINPRKQAFRNLLEDNSMTKESSNNPHSIFPKPKKPNYRKFMKKFLKSTRPPVIFKTIGPLKSREVIATDDLEDLKIIESRKNEIIVPKKILEKLEKTEECRLHSHSSSSSKNCV